MGFNRFVFQIIIRTILIAVNAIIIALLMAKPDWFFTFIFSCFFFIIQVVLFIRYTTKVNRELANFLIHIKEQDTTLAFSSFELDKSFKGLSNQFERINKQLQKLKAEQIQKQSLLNLLLDRVGTAIIVINSQSEVKLYNKSLLTIFDIELNSTTKWETICSFVKNINELNPGEQKVETIHVNNLVRKILVSVSEIKENNETLKVFSFHDIDREITDYELQSWNGLIKVLSHEIMNTITPMSTAVETIKDCITINGAEKNTEQLTSKDLSDTFKGIKLIENRFISLKNLITRFRIFSDIPTPDFRELELNDFLKSSIELYKNNYPAIHLEFVSDIDNIIIQADIDLLKLVLSNLFKNAAEALIDSKNPKIEIKTDKIKDKVYVDISDNGTGIEPTVIKKVFLPFFTTKKEGSGIGLSLSRQIMHMHHGNIEVVSDEKGTKVSLVFPSNIKFKF